MQYILGLLLSIIFSFPVYAQQRKAISSRQMASENKANNSSSLSQQFGWGLNYGTYFLYGSGKMSNGNEVVDRSMEFNNLGIFLDVTYNSWGLGYGYEYGQVAQKQSAAELNNTNISGYSANSSFRLSYSGSKYILSLNYKLSDKYSLANKNSLNQNVEYNLKSGYGAQLYYKLYKNFGVVLDYSNSTFKYESYSNDISQDRLGFGISYFN